MRFGAGLLLMVVTLAFAGWGFSKLFVPRARPPGMRVDLPAPRDGEEVDGDALEPRDGVCAQRFIPLARTHRAQTGTARELQPRYPHGGDSVAWRADLGRLGTTAL